MFFVSPRAMETVVGTTCDRDLFGDLMHDRLMSFSVPDRHGQIMETILDIVFGEREVLVVDEVTWKNTLSCLYFFFEYGDDGGQVLTAARVHGGDLDDLVLLCAVFDDHEYLIGSRNFLLRRFVLHVNTLTTGFSPGEIAYPVTLRLGLTSALADFAVEFDAEADVEAVLGKFDLLPA